MTLSSTRALTLPGAAAPEALVALACRAPSIHNTQPWAWRVRRHREGGPAELTLYADLRRSLPVEDPDGRGLVLSCGTALQHLVWAARCHGLAAHVQLLVDGADRTRTSNDGDLPVWLTPLARVELGAPADGDAAAPAPDTEGLALLLQRCTDRRRFTGWPVPHEHLATLVAAADAEAPATSTTAVVDFAHRFRLAALLHRVDDIVALDAARAAEQAAWVARSEQDGVPLDVLPTSAAPASPFGPGTLEEPHRRSAPLGGGEGLLLLGSAHDDVAGWLQTGRALGALWLEATRAGLSVVPVSQVVEVATVRSEIEADLLDGAYRAHLLLRVGWQAIGRSDLPRTPRRPVGDVLVD